MRKFASEGESSKNQFIEIHDNTVVTCKWCYNDRIYLGSMEGHVLELTATPNLQAKYATTRNEPLHCLSVSDIATSADGSKIVTSSLDGTCLVCNGDLERVREIECPLAISPHCGISRDGSVIAVAGAQSHVWVDHDGNLSELVIDEGEKRAKGDFFKAVSFYGANDESFVALSRHKLSLVDVATMRATTSLYGSTTDRQGELRRSLNCIATHPNQKLIAVGTIQGYIEFYDLSTRASKVSELKIGGHLVEKLEFSSDGRTLAIAQSNKKMALLDIEALSVTSEISPQMSRVLCVSFNRDCDQVVSVSEDKTVMIAPVVEQ